MRRFKVLQKLVEQLRRKEEWADWDFVLEIEQRATDSAPKIRAGYWGWVEVDWGDGNGVQRYTPPNNANGSFTGPSLSPRRLHRENEDESCCHFNFKICEVWPGLL